jgi:ligand-binding sensor domain-containing protein
MSVCRDHHGFLWIGKYADGGLFRYDGREFVKFTKENGLLQDTVPLIQTGPDDTVWIGSYDAGISRFDGKTFVNFVKEDGLISQRILSMYTDSSGDIWFGTGWWGIFRYDGENVTNVAQGVPFSHGVNTIYPGDDGTIWFGIGGCLAKYDGANFQILTAADGLPSNCVFCIHRDNDGR